MLVKLFPAVPINNWRRVIKLLAARPVFNLEIRSLVTKCRNCTTIRSALSSLCESVRPSVCPSVCYQLVKLFITLEPHGMFYHILHTYARQHSLTTGMRTHPFLIDIGLVSNNCPAFCGQLENIIMTLDSFRILGSNFAYSFILIFSMHPGM